MRHRTLAACLTLTLTFPRPLFADALKVQQAHQSLIRSELAVGLEEPSHQEGGTPSWKEMERRKRFIEWARTSQGMRSSSYKDLQHELLIHYRDLVVHQARRIARKLPPLALVDLDDMISVGTIGLMDALRNYDPAQGVKLSTYVRHRIRGAILDELRKVGWEKRRIRGLAKVLQQEGKASLSTEEAASFLRVEPEVAQRALALLHSVGGLTSLDKRVYIEDDGREVLRRDLLADPREPDPSHRIEQRDYIRYLMRLFTDRERLIILLYYYEGWTTKQIGQELDLDESRIVQILGDLHQRIRERAEKFLDQRTVLMRLDTIPRRLRYARLARGLPQSDVNSDHERKTKRPRRESLERYAHRYRVPMEWLEKGEGVPDFLEPEYLDSVDFIEIEKARKEKGISVGIFAQAAGITLYTYRSYMRGEVIPAPEVLKQLRDALEGNFSGRANVTAGLEEAARLAGVPRGDVSEEAQEIRAYGQMP